MSAIKPGDRVHVEFDADVREGTGSDRALRVLIDDVDGTDWMSLVPRSVCTVIAPPVQVGDVVTAENIGQLPDESVVAEGFDVLLRRHDSWIQTGSSNEYDDDCVFGGIVLRIGGGES